MTETGASRPRRPSSGGRLLSRLSLPEVARVAAALRTETVGGGLLLGATIVALVWSNTALRHTYESVREARLGIAAWHLDLTLQQWSADGLLALFFLVAGIELKHELVVGELSDRAKAILPVVAALSGVVVPALVYVAVAHAAPGTSRGWAVPTATDIAFALAVLAVSGAHLPTALRAFLLTLAVVDDLVAITIIALVYTDHLSPIPLLLAPIPLLGFAFLVQRRVRSWWLVLVGLLALVTWALVHASGVHATVAGVLLGLCVPVRRRPDETVSYAHRVEHRLRPVSAGFGVPVFALLSAGVPLTGGGLSGAVRDRAAVAVAVALVAGKAVGVFGGSWLVARFTRAELDDELGWPDLFGVALLSGVGFTVSLLIAELAFGAGSPRDADVKIAVLVGSVVSAVLAVGVLRWRNRAHRTAGAHGHH